MRANEMLRGHKSAPVNAAEFAECINACHACAQACTSCADACLSEEQVGVLTRCIRLDLDCADICDATARVLSRQTQPEQQVIRQQVQACALICRLCAEECEKHQDKHEHCRVCAAECRRCEQLCNQMLG